MYSQISRRDCATSLKRKSRGWLREPMMLFLIEYDRSRGTVVSMRTFDDSQRQSAEDARLSLELKLNRERVQQEVVLLEAPTEEALRLTHRRYFEDLIALARSSASSTDSKR